MPALERDDRHDASHRRGGARPTRAQGGLGRRAPPRVPRRRRRARRRAALLPADGRGRGGRRRPDRAQGRDLDEGRRDNGGLEDPRRLRARVRCNSGSALPRGRPAGDRQDQHGRVCDGVVDRELGLRPDAQSLGPGAGAGRLGRRHRRRGLRRARALGARLRHRRLDQAAVGALRQRRPPPDLRDGQPLRRRRVRVEPRPDRACREERPRLRAALLDHRRQGRRRLDHGRRARGRASRGREPRGPADRRSEGDERGRGDRAGRHGGGAEGDRAGARARRRRGGVRAPALGRVRPRVLLPDRPGRGILEPGPLRRRPLRPPRRRRYLLRDGRAHARRGLRRRAEAPDHARHLRALRRLLRRLLRSGPEGADADRTRTRGGVRALRPACLADLADRRLQAGREGGRPARDVPLRPAHDPVLHGRAAGPERARAGSRTGCRWACS